MHKNSTSPREAAKNAVVFVHGLSGSAASTWGQMAKCFNEDGGFGGFEVDYYTYPTRLIRLPFTPPLPGLRDLADGLRTFIEENHGDKDSVNIVAHSLGGLIARHMIVSSIRSEVPLKVQKLVLIAVPNSGASLASVGSLISMHHRQLKALCKDQQGLIDLNIHWEQLKLEELLTVKYVLGGCDRVVPPESAAPYIGRENRSVVIDADHRSIVSPADRNDIRYKIIRRFLLDDAVGQACGSDASTDKRSHGRADPLFEVYVPKHDPYYVVRSFDSVLGDVLANAHVWLSGSSGIGKTAAARRAIYSSGWNLLHINLAGHDTADSLALFRALAAELRELAGIDPPIQEQGLNQEMIDTKNAISTLCSDKVTAILVEEMPLPEAQLGSAAKVLTDFLELLDGDSRLHGQVRMLFSSRAALRSETPGLDSKAREKIQFLPVDAWNESDINRLVKLLTPAIRPSLTQEAQQSVVSAANGSPRFVKMLFRHWRNRTAHKKSVDELCTQVARELV